MPLFEPRHSKEPNCEVYHIHSECTEANNIEQRYFEWGTGGKRLCKHCEQLANGDAMVKKFSQKMTNSLISGMPSPLGAASSLFASFKKPK